MYLFVDGARMGYGLGAEDNDLTLKDFAELTDVFYIGGTKCGALFVIYQRKCRRCAKLPSLQLRSQIGTPAACRIV